MELHQIKAYITYWLDAVNRYSLHSPFVFDFYHQVLKKESAENFQPIEKLRDDLINSKRKIRVDDFGSKRKKYHQQERGLSEITKQSAVEARFGKLYNRIVKYTKAKHIIELGTSLGIGTAYLAWNHTETVNTFEACAQTAHEARFNFEYLNLKNIEVHTGEIENTLPKYLVESKKIDLALIDANHNYEPTLRYFKWILGRCHLASIVIIHDIHQSAAMEKAWQEIKKNEQVYCSIDLFHCGLIFFDPALNKQHHILQF
ncbi:MAG TPA: class I SAM-dependent methyltransferase [Cyclobacteriaceae bacterium]|nr:class I SAM-dependent methyltransferase [Cyclobacteriaceae bacterium]